MGLTPATKKFMQGLEEHVDHLHESNPLMRSESQVAVAKAIFAVESAWRGAVAGTNFRLEGRDPFDVFIRAASVLDQCLTWLSTSKTTAPDTPACTADDSDVERFLELAGSYAHLCVAFTAWHRRVTTAVLVDETQRLVQITLPKRVIAYHSAAMRFHHAPTPLNAEEALRVSRQAMLAHFSGDLRHIPKDTWQYAFDALYRIVDFDWDLEWSGDLGGFTLLEARRAAVALRLWSELLIFSNGGIVLTEEALLASLLATSCDFTPEVATAIVKDMAFDFKRPNGDASSYPLIRPDGGSLITWSPVKVLVMNHHRELLRRLSTRDRATHNALSDAKHDALIRRVHEVVTAYEPRLLFVKTVQLADTDIDVVLIDSVDGTYLCLEVKAHLSPRTLREALEVDARVSSKGKITDGLLKGSSTQILKILRLAADAPVEFRSRIQTVAGSVVVPVPRRVFGAVLSSWTFGTGAADEIECQDLPSQRTVRVLPLSLLRHLLAECGGSLELVYAKLEDDGHLRNLTTPTQKVRYGEWTFEMQYS